jgi:hypothetical protein
MVMFDFADFPLRAAVIGTSATATIDAWAFARARLTGAASLDYALVGRWLAYCVHLRFHHDAIARSPPVRGERALGWAFHYATGIVFAAVLLAIGGGEWARHPSFGLALMVGVASAAAPLFVMQPGMGLGIAASRTPNPRAARMRTLVTHAVFGVGLYLGARVAAVVF